MHFDWFFIQNPLENKHIDDFIIDSFLFLYYVSQIDSVGNRSQNISKCDKNIGETICLVCHFFVCTTDALQHAIYLLTVLFKGVGLNPV